MLLFIAFSFRNVMEMLQLSSEKQLWEPIRADVDIPLLKS